MPLVKKINFGIRETPSAYLDIINDLWFYFQSKSTCILFLSFFQYINPKVSDNQVNNYSKFCNFNWAVNFLEPFKICFALRGVKNNE